MGKIRVLVVDDSAFMRKIISDFLSEKDEIEIIGTANLQLFTECPNQH